MASSAPELSCAGGGRRSSYLHFSWIVQLALLAALFRLGAASGQISLAVGDDGSIPGRLGGIRAALIHRDKFFLQSLTNEGHDPGKDRSSSSLAPAVGESHDGARRSLRRVEALARQSQSRRQRRQLAEDKDDDEEAAATRFRRSRLQAVVPSPPPSPSPAEGPSGDWESPLSDASAGEYIMEITLGSPPQTYHAVADTGSDLTWIQCSPCGADCFQQEDPLFDPSSSSTYTNVSCASDACNFLSNNENCVYDASAPEGSECDYSYSYGDNSSTSGTLAQDTISLEAFVGDSVQKFANFTFGCSHNASTTSDLFDVTNGLVGLGRGDISFPVQLGQYFGMKFSYCLVSRLSNDVEESPLVFGDAALSDGSVLQYTPMGDSADAASPSTFYYVHLDNITVNDVTTPLPDDVFGFNIQDGTGGIIFDSGTTYTSFVDDAFDPFLRSVSTAVTGYTKVDSSDSSWELCYQASWDAWSDDFGKGVPKISFNFRNASSFDLEVEGSWVEVQPRVICLAFLRSQSISIIGARQQIDKLILYDLQKEVIGFVPQKCDSSDSSLRHPSSADKFAAPFDRTISLLVPAFILLLQVSLTMMTKCV